MPERKQGRIGDAWRKVRGWLSAGLRRSPQAWHKIKRWLSINQRWHWRRARRRKERIALIASLISMGLTLLAAAWLFIPLRGSTGAPPEVFALDYASRVIVFLGAVTTFMTVIWRGFISARQTQAQLRALDNQTEQIRLTRRQLKSSEEDTLAELLQKGAELIVSDRQAQISAGIVTLQAVATADNQRFASEAMDLLVDELQTHGANSHGSTVIGQLISALENGRKIGRKSSRTIAFQNTDYRDSNFDPETVEPWRVITGARHVAYRGGAFKSLFSRTPVLDEFTSYYLVYFRGMDISMERDWRFRDCLFSACKFIRFPGEASTWNNFENCNFSGCEVDMGDFADLRDGGNYFYTDTPPLSSSPIEWSTVLHARDRGTDDEIPF